MQKFDDEIFDILNELEKISKSVNINLKEKDTPNEEIFLLYENRNIFLKKLINLKNDENWNDFLLKNNTKFFKKIDDIQNIENDNIKMLENLTYEIGKELQNLNKSKNLLIYK